MPRYIAFLLSLAITIPLFALSGHGTAVDPYLLTNIVEVQSMNNDLTAHYALVQSIDASATASWNSGSGFVPIGLNPAFTGEFDGRGHEIRGLTINRPTSDFQALFGVVSGGFVHGVRLTGASIRANRFSAILVGNIANEALVTDCSVAGQVTIGPAIDGNYDAKSGGLAGSVWGGVFIQRCSSSADVYPSGRGQIGGLVGYLRGVDPGPTGKYSTLSDSWSSGTVYGSGYKLGDLVGDADGSIVRRCFSCGYGIGMIGYNFRAPIITDCYYDSSKSPGTPYGGTPRTTAQMKLRATFVGWDFDHVWDLDEGESYPYLRLAEGSSQPVPFDGTVFRVALIAALAAMALRVTR